MNKSGEETILSLPERHNRILALLQQNGSISVVQLAELFKVSEVTIRKDLSFLEQQKKLYRTHGSAILISPYISDRHVNEKEKKNVAEKRAIGAKAASLVAQDDSIIIASGCCYCRNVSLYSTCLYFDSGHILFYDIPPNGFSVNYYWGWYSSYNSFVCTIFRIYILSIGGCRI